MPYTKNGKEQFTMKEKRAYHKQIADSGKKDGIKITETERTRHATLANKYGSRLQTFMAHSENDRQRMVNGNKPNGKPEFN